MAFHQIEQLLYKNGTENKVKRPTENILLANLNGNKVLRINIKKYIRNSKQANSRKIIAKLKKNKQIE